MLPVLVGVSQSGEVCVCVCVCQCVSLCVIVLRVVVQRIRGRVAGFGTCVDAKNT